MPFKSDAQRRKCWILYNKAIKSGKKPKWDCVHWEIETRKIIRKKPRSKTKK